MNGYSTKYNFKEVNIITADVGFKLYKEDGSIVEISFPLFNEINHGFTYFDVDPIYLKKPARS